MLFGGAGVWQGAGVGGGTASATTAVGNDIPRASRSAAAAFFARMDVRPTMAGAAMLSGWRLREQMLDGATRGGGRATRVIFATEDDDDGWDLPPPPARRRRMRRCSCHLRLTTETTKTRVRDNAALRDATRGGGGDDKGRERSVDDARRESGE
jgi:hypothetical protein